MLDILHLPRVLWLVCHDSEPGLAAIVAIRVDVAFSRHAYVDSSVFAIMKLCAV